MPLGHAASRARGGAPERRLPPAVHRAPLRFRRTLICVEPVQANETDVVPLASLQFTLEARFPVMTTTASQAVSSTWER